MSISPTQPNFSGHKAKFSGYQQAQYSTPYPGLYGTGAPASFYAQPVMMANPELDRQQKSSLLTKLLIGGIVLGGGAFALHKLNPEYSAKLISYAETVTPDFIKNGITTVSNKAKDLFGKKTIQEAAPGFFGKVKSAIAWPFKSIGSFFSSAKPH